MRPLMVCLLTGLLAGMSGAPAFAAAPKLTPSTPNLLHTDCRNRVHTPPPVDSSEVPAPGSTTPHPLPVPATPVGGPRMDGCTYILPRGAPPLPPKLAFQSWVIFDVDSGDVLAARAPHARLRPASLIKMVLALLVARELDPQQVVVGTQADANAEGSKVGIGPGGRYTVDQLLHGLLLCSGNDAAHALARQFGGTERALAQENRLVRSLGALDTRVASPSGLDAPGMSSSAYDLSVIFSQLLHNDYLRRIIHTRNYHFPGFGRRPGFPITNDNRLLGTYPGDIGGKTGYTDDATHTYANAARRHGVTIGVVMMHNSNHLRGTYRNARALMRYGFALASRETVPVGTIVRSAEADRTPAAQAGHAHARAAAPPDVTVTGGSRSVMTIVLVVVLALLAAGLALLLWRRRRNSS